MLPIFDNVRDITFFSTLLRMVLAFVCGACVGLERSYKNRPAGFRTHILICLGACMASMTGVYLYLNLGLPTDMSRIGAQVVTGLGFIGAGTIIVTKKSTVKGLTTAAGLWTTGIVGLAIGGGFYEGGILCTALILFAEIVFYGATKNFRRSPDFKLELHYDHKKALDQVMRHCKNNKLSITNLQITGTSSSDASVYSAMMTLRPQRHAEHQDLVAHIRGMEGILSVDEI